MSVEALMNQSVTVLLQGAETRNAINEVTGDDPTEVATTMYLEPTKAREEQVDRNTPIADWRGYGRTDVPFASTSRIVYGSHTFDVMGEPEPFWDPRIEAVSHIEMDLQEVT